MNISLLFTSKKGKSGGREEEEMKKVYSNFYVCRPEARSKLYFQYKKSEFA